MAIELDTETKQQLADEAERLVRAGMDRQKARRAVWDDYQAAQAGRPEQRVSRPLETPVPEPPRSAKAEPGNDKFFTPERLQKNRTALAKLKQQIGLRNTQ
ncbi:hypothetical protein R0381_003615 [Jeongeupia wiesaeckerbachi]|uniref:hypothetical protein n=1 Tax=Jeongeupia wiesaeckerbachi TaxID=3051218 RepID=UPI003D8051EC